VPDPGDPIAWNRFAYVYNNPVNYADPSGHVPVLLAAAYTVVDTAWDIVDVYSDIRDCFGDSDSMACAMLPIDALAVVALFAEGPSNNVARRTAKAADVGDAAGDVGRRIDPRVRAYANAVNSNRPWSWAEDIPGGVELSARQRAAIKQSAINEGLIPDIPLKPGTQYADFGSKGLVQRVDHLPGERWLQGDAAQFSWLDERIPGGRPPGTTWHHSEIPGRMELVPFGPHNITNHMGGRSAGHWARRPGGRR